MRTLFVPFLVVVLAINAASARADCYEREQIRLLSAFEAGKTEPRKFRIRGMAKSGFGVCGKPRTSMENRDLIIKIPKKHLSHGLNTGPYFDLTIEAPADTERLLFGQQKIEIWPVDRMAEPLSDLEKDREKRAIAIVRKAFRQASPDEDWLDYSYHVSNNASPDRVFVRLERWLDGRPSPYRTYLVDLPSNSIVYGDEEK